MIGFVAVEGIVSVVSGVGTRKRVDGFIALPEGSHKSKRPSTMSDGVS